MRKCSIQFWNTDALIREAQVPGLLKKDRPSLRSLRTQAPADKVRLQIVLNLKSRSDV